MSIYFSVQLVSLLTSAEAKICFLSAQEDADWYFLIRKAWKHSCREAHFSRVCVFVCVCVCVCVCVGGLVYFHQEIWSLFVQTSQFLRLFWTYRPAREHKITDKSLLSSPRMKNGEIMRSLMVCARVVVSGQGVKGSVAPWWPLSVQFPFYWGPMGEGLGDAPRLPWHQGEGAGSTSWIPTPRLSCVASRTLGNSGFCLLWGFNTYSVSAVGIV